MHTLERQITQKTLRALADEIIYALGEKYLEAGVVTGLRRINNTLIATVAGSEPADYVIILKPGMKSIDYQCSCPMGEDGACCKHVVAAGLASLEYGEVLQDDTDLIHDYLLTQPKEILADRLLELRLHPDNFISRPPKAKNLTEHTTFDAIFNSKFNFITSWNFMI